MSPTSGQDYGAEILIITVIGILGINTSSFLAIFASAGVAIGLALSGTLQNFAGGVLILLLKPYKIAARRLRLQADQTGY